VWILRPPGKIVSIVVFGHGWSTPFPSGFGAWIRHLREQGNLVVYPRYRTNAYETTNSALTAFRHGVAAAFRNIGPTSVPVVAVGKSFGGSAVFYYAAEAKRWGVRAPAAVLSIFPALPIGAFPARPLRRRTYVQILVGDRDTTAGSTGADAFWRWLRPHPSDRKRYLVIHSRPGFVANHDSPQRTDRVARSVFWARLDRLIARVRHTT
jgi:dienelactone hydrolase